MKREPNTKNAAVKKLVNDFLEGLSEIELTEKDAREIITTVKENVAYGFDSESELMKPILTKLVMDSIDYDDTSVAWELAPKLLDVISKDDALDEIETKLVKMVLKIIKDINRENSWRY